MALVGKLYFEKQPPYNAQQLATQLGIGAEACNKVVNALLEAKLLIKTGDDPPALIPGYALEVMLLIDIVNAVRTNGESASLNPSMIMSPMNVQRAYERLEHGMHKSLRNLTVKDLLDVDSKDSAGATTEINTNISEGGDSDENNVRKLSN